MAIKRNIYLKNKEKTPWKTGDTHIYTHTSGPLFGIHPLTCASSEIPEFKISPPGKQIQWKKFEAILLLFQGNMLCFLSVVVEEYLEL